MKRILLLMTGVALSTAISAQDLPQPSPQGEIEQKVGLTEVEIEYSRPGVKDRQIFGDLVPYGTMWRTGANKATAISFSTDVKVNGNDLIAGEYSLFTVPGEDSWDIMFNTNLEQWGTGNYQESEEALRIKVKPEEYCFTESMTFDINNLRDNSATVCLMWEKTKVCFDIEVEVDAIAEQNIKDKIAEIENAYGVYNTSARWYLDHEKDAAQALKWASKSVSIEQKFWNLHTLARAQAANGDYKAAIATAGQSLEAAKEAGYDAYIKMNEEKIAEWKKKK